LNILQDFLVQIRLTQFGYQFAVAFGLFTEQIELLLLVALHNCYFIYQHRYRKCGI